MNSPPAKRQRLLENTTPPGAPRKKRNAYFSYYSRLYLPIRPFNLDEEEESKEDNNLNPIYTTTQIPK
jgi:hypothetical protein